MKIYIQAIPIKSAEIAVNKGFAPNFYQIIAWSTVI